MKIFTRVYIIFCIALLSSLYTAFSIDYTYINLHIHNNAVPEQTLDSLSFGVNIFATDSIDAFLGEKEYPTIGLPSSIFMAYMVTFDARQNQTVWTWHDYRPFAKDSQHFYREYNIKLFFGEGTSVTVSWDKLSDYIDSAYVQDPFAAYINVNMKQFNEFTTDNILLDEFVFKIWFNTTGTSVAESYNESKLSVFPNPTKNFININPDIQFHSITIYDISGMEIFKKVSNNSSNLINLPNLNSGIYLVKICDIFGNNYFDKIIIQ
ncbi:MAG TPA: T9SS type A sorting domain-containing protein [Bacteroidota bacterium]|nr:T9SS type A sorting domain-containing protein [Bacteroidota bacterium]